LLWIESLFSRSNLFGRRWTGDGGFGAGRSGSQPHSITCPHTHERPEMRREGGVRDGERYRRASRKTREDKTE
jgi:hypothetical protein